MKKPVFHPPPGWPQPPTEWTPQPGWLPQPEWPPPPPGWQFWSDVPSGPQDRVELASRPFPQQLYNRPTTIDTGPTAEAGPGVVMKWAGWAALSLVALLGLVSGGIPGLLMLTGMAMLIVVLVAFVRGRVSWAGLTTTTSKFTALVASLTAIAAATAMSSGTSSTASDAPSTTGITSPSSPMQTSATASRDPIQVILDSAPKGSTLAMLATLTVADATSGQAYDRASFGQAWSDTDRNGCDQRNDTLRRDFLEATLKAGTHGCVVWTGKLVDPYTGKTVNFTRAVGAKPTVAIDHVVALADAWNMGATTWTKDKRLEFANDPLNLLATSLTVNIAKGAADAAYWLPPDVGARCAYVARQVAVKQKYGLAVTTDERRVIVETLRSCPRTATPRAAIAKLGGWPTFSEPVPFTATPKPSPTTSTQPPPTSPNPIRGVHPGAFCSPVGALGYTDKGTLMRCSVTPTDGRARWRSA